MVRMLDVPSELKPFINLNECCVQKCTDGRYVIIDHSIQAAIASGTMEELEEYLRLNK